MCESTLPQPVKNKAGLNQSLQDPCTIIVPSKEKNVS